MNTMPDEEMQYLTELKSKVENTPIEVLKTDLGGFLGTIQNINHGKIKISSLD